MDTNELRNNFIHSMSKAIMDINPKMVIRRLQNDNAFAIYSNVDATDRIGNTHKHTILIDIVTEKTKPAFFKTIKNMIKFLEKPRSHYFSSVFYSVIVKDDNDNVIEKLIKFDYRAFAVKDGEIVVDGYIDQDDEFNILKMLYNCAEFLIEHKSMFDRFFPASKSAYSYFRYGFVLMDNQSVEDEVLEKVITDDLFGYRYIEDAKYTKLENSSQTITYKTRCPNELCRHTNEDNCLIDVVLYYTAESSLDTNRKLYLQGEFAYIPLHFNTSDIDVITKRYIIPRTWFDFEDVMYVYNAKIDFITCGNCGREI